MERKPTCTVKEALVLYLHHKYNSDRLFLTHEKGLIWKEGLSGEYNKATSDTSHSVWQASYKSRDGHWASVFI